MKRFHWLQAGQRQWRVGALLILLGIGGASALTELQRRHADTAGSHHAARNLLIGLIIGVLLALVAIVLAEGRRRALPGPTDLERLMGAPVLGAVPWEHPREALVVAAKPDSIRADAYRRIAGSMDHEARIVAVVGAGSRVGVSSLVSNLGLLLARSDRGVAMLDGGSIASGGADIAKHADATLVVVRPEHTGQADVRRARARLGQVGASVLGVIVNGTSDEPKQAATSPAGEPPPIIAAAQSAAWLRPDILEKPEPTYAPPHRADSHGREPLGAGTSDVQRASSTPVARHRLGG